MSKERDYYFDNYKALLIVMVVMGHFIGPASERFGLVEGIYKFIFLFHMPAFIFICGYFSKHNDFVKLVKSILIPYLILQVIYYFFYNFVWGEQKAFSFIKPAYTMWFLLCLFIWRVMIDKIKNQKGLILICMFLGIIGGFCDFVGKTCSLSRMIVFFPYFVMGYRFDKQKYITVIKKVYIEVLAGIFLCGVFLFMMVHYDQVSFRLLEASYSYEEMKLSYGWILRILLYIISTGIIFAIAIFIPKNRHCFSYLGSRTMGIYMVHGIILKTITYCTDWYDEINTPLEVVALFIASLVLCILLSTRLVSQATGWMSHIPVDRLFLKMRTRI